MVKSEIITWIAKLPEDDPRLEAVKKIQTGEQTECEEEPMMSLKDVSAAVELHPSWLHRLRVPQSCGIRLAGSRRYRKSDVLKYLQSDRCLERVRELRNERENTKKEQEHGN